MSWFVNVGQLIIVWTSCVAGGLRILFLSVGACLSAYVMSECIRYSCNGYKHFLFIRSVCAVGNDTLQQQEKLFAFTVLSVRSVQTVASFNSS